MRIVFMGTPDFAIPSLKALLKSPHEIVGVITAPDKPAGRGQQMRESAVKQFAKKRGLYILQPTNLKDEHFQEELASLEADIQVVVAFRMLPRSVWDMPPEGTINLHASLLPKYRGAAPINWAIIHGERETGVTTFRLQHEIDTGNILFQEKTSIGPNETAGELYNRLRKMGAKLVLKTIDAIEDGTAQPKPQAEDEVTKAPKIDRDTCRISFDRSASDVHNFIRGLSPWPGAWTHLNDKQLKIFKTELTYKPTDKDPGQLETKDGSLYVATADDWLEIMELQLEGRKKMNATDFINGYTIEETSRCKSNAQEG